MIIHAAWVFMGRRDKPGDDEGGLDVLETALLQVIALANQTKMV